MATLRLLEPSDYDIVSPVIDTWWGGRPMRAMLPRLFFEHFNTTSFVIGAPGTVDAFLVGFRSQTLPHVGYIHFVGVAPNWRRAGLGRLLYERFFAAVVAWGGREVHCITYVP